MEEDRPRSDMASLSAARGKAGLGTRNQNPPGIGLWALLQEDRRTYGSWLDQGLWAITVHRFGNWRMDIRPRAVRLPFSFLYKVLDRVVQWSCGIRLPYTVKLGRRVKIWYSGGMVLNANSIGDDVHIRHNTTFGIAHRGDANSIPTIEDRVDIGCGAVILGRITIGHDAVVGANAVVLADVPPHSVAVGVPARIVEQCRA
jgi:serine O-acetyltransferase